LKVKNQYYYQSPFFTMWSNFTDFALKAQKELQDKAHEAAQALEQSVGSTGSS
jgi:uncharacterized protein with GYD domain